MGAFLAQERSDRTYFKTKAPIRSTAPPLFHLYYGFDESWIFDRVFKHLIQLFELQAVRNPRLGVDLAGFHQLDDSLKG